MKYKKYKNDEKECSKEEYFIYQKAKILSLIYEGKISLARKLTLDILKDYPKEDAFLRILANICIIEQDYLGAIRILESLDEKENHRLLTSLYIKINDQKKMEEFYQKYYSNNLLFDQAVYQLSDEDFLEYQMHLYLKKIFDFNLILNWGNLVYLCSQIYSYDNRRAVGHVEVHHQEKKEANKGIFDASIHLYSLFYQVQDYINVNKDKGMFEASIVDRYCFYYPNCGKNRRGKAANYFEVISLVNTSDIITMYPISSRVSEYHDICYLDETNPKSLVKVRNGLERFKDRYNKS